jgi:hypothetical protein
MSYDPEKSIGVGVHEQRHVEEISDSPTGLHITKSAFNEAQQDALSQGKPQWQVIRENAKTCAVIVAVQVSALQSVLPLMERKTHADVSL